MGKWLILAVVFLVISGLILHFKVEVPWITNWLGKLPGDIVIKKKGMTIYFPIATSLLLSFVLSLILSLVFKAEK